MTFKDHLSKSTSKDVAIISPTCSYTRIELITAASSLAPKLNLKKDFLVDGNEVATAVIQMLALDGKSPVILFKPNNFSEELSEKFQKFQRRSPINLINLLIGLWLLQVLQEFRNL